MKRGLCGASCCVLLEKCPNCNVNVNESFSISCHWHANCLVMLHSRLVHQRPDACSLTFAKFTLGFVRERNVWQFENCLRMLSGSSDSCDLMKENEEEEVSITELEQHNRKNLDRSSKQLLLPKIQTKLYFYTFTMILHYLIGLIQQACYVFLL